MKGVRWTKPRLEIASKVLDELTKLSAERPDMSIVCMFEYFGLTKACSVPDDATACLRSPYCNVLNVVRWDDLTEENLVFARTASRNVADIAISGNVELEDKNSAGYGNYGELRSLYVIIVMTDCSVF